MSTTVATTTRPLSPALMQIGENIFTSFDSEGKYLVNASFQWNEHKINLISLGKSITDNSGRIVFYLTAKQAAATTRTFNTDRLDQFFAFIAKAQTMTEPTTFENNDGTYGELYAFNGKLLLPGKEINARLEVRLITDTEGNIMNGSIKLLEAGLTIAPEIRVAMELLKSRFMTTKEKPIDINNNDNDLMF